MNVLVIDIVKLLATGRAAQQVSFRAAPVDVEKASGKLKAKRRAP